jgi:hypothetical protein
VPEEAEEVARLAETLAGCSWRDRDGAVRPVGRDGILVVTPYNAQIRAIQGALAARERAVALRPEPADQHRGPQVTAR